LAFSRDASYTGFMKTKAFLWSTILLLLLIPGLLIADQPASPEIAIFEQGIASWYTSDPNGNLTANGETFNPDSMAAAHKHLKFGSIVQVTDLQTGKSIEVRINDRGPYVDGRIIDLTPAAAKALGMYEKGIVPVALRMVYEPEVPQSLYDRPGDTGWYLLQLGSFSNTKTVLAHYNRLVLAGYKMKIEIVNESLVRMSVRWIHESQLERTLAVLSTLGFKDVLKRSEKNPYR